MICKLFGHKNSKSYIGPTDSCERCGATLTWKMLYRDHTCVGAGDGRCGEPQCSPVFGYGG
jgi:hypothetical protein